MKYWLVKQEPSSYSWDDFVNDRETAWTGVRNHQAKRHLSSMRVGDKVLFYHSVIGKEVVGEAQVKREAYPDPTAEPDSPWVCVDLAPLAALSAPVPLERIKSEPALSGIPLLRQSRLSVMPLTAAEYRKILSLGKSIRTGQRGASST